MNKTLIAVILIALLGLGFYFYNNSRSGGDSSTGTSMTDSDETSGPTSLKGLLGMGKNQQCTFSSEGSTGTVYISGDRMRTDVTMTADGVDSSMSMITDGEWMYYWGSAMPQGIKMKLDLEATMEDYAADSEGEMTQSLDINQEFDYDCSNWRVDASKFEVPSDVDFLDFSAQMDATTGTTPGETPSMCSYCEYMTGEDKEACLVAYNC